MLIAVGLIIAQLSVSTAIESVLPEVRAFAVDGRASPAETYELPIYMDDESSCVVEIPEGVAALLVVAPCTTVSFAIPPDIEQVLFTPAPVAPDATAIHELDMALQLSATYQHRGGDEPVVLHLYEASGVRQVSLRALAPLYRLDFNTDNMVDESDLLIAEALSTYLDGAPGSGLDDPNVIVSHIKLGDCQVPPPDIGNDATATLGMRLLTTESRFALLTADCCDELDESADLTGDGVFDQADVEIVRDYVIGAVASNQTASPRTQQGNADQ